MSSDRYLLQAEPHSGPTTELPKTSLDQVFDFILGLMNKVHARESNNAVINNRIASIPLLNELYKKGTILD